MTQVKKRASSPKPKKMSSKDLAKLIEKTGDQYRIYKELHDVVDLVRSMPRYQPVDLPPSFDYPHVGTFDMSKKKK